MKRPLKYIYFSVNLVGALVFLYAYFHTTSLVMREGRIETDGVDGITFFVFSAPAFAVGLLANATLGMKAVTDAWGARDYRAFGYLAVGLLTWGLAILCMRLHWAIYVSS